MRAHLPTLFQALEAIAQLFFRKTPVAVLARLIKKSSLVKSPRLRFDEVLDLGTYAVIPDCSQAFTSSPL